MNEKLLENYNQDGFCIANIFDESSHKLIIEYTKDLVINVLKNNASKDFNNNEFELLDLKEYHLWQNRTGYEHDGVFGAKNRYLDPPKNIKNLILNENLKNFLKLININDFNLWRDPGLEWLGFRIIRPNMNDGYPVSCKNWGAAAGVVSVWFPIIGFSNLETLAIVPGSHKKNYQKYLPEDTKFIKGEYRFSGDTNDLNFVRPNLKLGEAIIYHPAALHTEDVKDSKITRINLEFRFTN